LNQAKEATANTVKQDVDNLNYYKQAISSAQTGVDATQKAYDATVTAYNSGLQDYMQVQDMEKQLDTTKLSLLQVKVAYITGMFQLEYDLNTNLN
jgi:outer membrane protein TolC